MVLRSLAVLAFAFISSTTAFGNSISHPSCELNVIERGSLKLNPDAISTLLKKGYITVSLQVEQAQDRLRAEDLVLEWTADINVKTGRVFTMQRKNASVTLKKVLRVEPEPIYGTVFTKEKSSSRPICKSTARQILEEMRASSFINIAFGIQNSFDKQKIEECIGNRCGSKLAVLF